MNSLSTIEAALLERAAAAPMLSQVQDWAAINSGSRHLDGLARMASALADSFAVLPGDVTLIDAAPVETMRADGQVEMIIHGQHLHLSVRPQAPVQILLTGHMDTVFAADHPFRAQRWIESGVLNGPGVADMKGGLAAIEKLFEAFGA